MFSKLSSLSLPLFQFDGHRDVALITGASTQSLISNAGQIIIEIV